jgi:glutamine synthetase type III
VHNEWINDRSLAAGIGLSVAIPFGATGTEFEEKSYGSSYSVYQPVLCLVYVVVDLQGYFLAKIILSLSYTLQTLL